MAAADLILMACYFSFLTILMSWKQMRIWFPGRQIKTSIVSAYHSEKESNVSSRENNRLRMVLSALFAVMLTYCIVESSIIFEKKTSHIVPGLGSASVAFMSVGVSILLGRIPKFVTQMEKDPGLFPMIQRCISYLKRDLKRVTSPLSAFCFHLLFAGIGTSANLGNALYQGPISFVFTTVALIIHMLVICFGSLLVMKIKHNFFPLDVEEILVASNAAIGGASTAAAFAGKVAKEGDWSDERTRGLVVAATFYGVLGYAFATAVGVRVSNFLLFLLK